MHPAWRSALQAGRALGAAAAAGKLDLQTLATFDESTCSLEPLPSVPTPNGTLDAHLVSCRCCVSTSSVRHSWL